MPKQTNIALWGLVILLLLSEKGWSQVSSYPIQSIAVSTDFRETGRLDEIKQWCSALSANFKNWVECRPFFKTPEGREIWVFLVGKHRKPGSRPTVFFQGGIHAGEIDGKDAGILFLTDLLQRAQGRTELSVLGRRATDFFSKKEALNVLKKMTLVFVPVFNSDGHERFGFHNRPNQRGPKEMGWRTTAMNLNLNRDYAKAEAPEMQGMLNLLNKWDPVVYADLHVTDGAKFQHDVSIIVEPFQRAVANTPASEALRGAAEKLSNRLLSGLKKLQHLPLDFYPSFETDDDPESGITRTPTPPRFSQGYWASRGRVGILVETHSWKPYFERVRATYNFLFLMARDFVESAESLKSLVNSGDRERRKNFGEISSTLSFKPDMSQPQVVDFLGFAYERIDSPVSGSKETQYDENKPMIWKMKLFSSLMNDRVVSIPKGFGYWIPPQEREWVEKKLKTHQIEYSEFVGPKIKADCEQYVSKEIEFSKTSYEGRQTLKLKGDWKREKCDLSRGGLFVSLHQPKQRLVLLLFEPNAGDSFLSWGFFNRYFEQKEYMERYVAHLVGEEMLKNPKIKDEFDQALRGDKAFRDDPEKRLEFFYKKHPSWDSRFGVYPVLRVFGD